jgi:hypothetical protein
VRAARADPDDVGPAAGDGVQLADLRRGHDEEWHSR